MNKQAPLPLYKYAECVNMTHPYIKKKNMTHPVLFSVVMIPMLFKLLRQLNVSGGMMKFILHSLWIKYRF